jgi:hypothetical protein
LTIDIPTEETTMTTTTHPATREQIMAAILAALAPTGTTLVAWRTVRAQLSVVKVRGSCFVRLTDDFDRQAAANERDRAAQTGWPRPRCRDFVAV